MVTATPETAIELRAMRGLPPVCRLIFTALLQQECLGYDGLIEATGLSRRTITHHVNRMRQWGLVEKRCDTGDNGVPLPAEIRLTGVSVSEMHIDSEGSYAN